MPKIPTYKMMPYSGGSMTINVTTYERPDELITEPFNDVSKRIYKRITPMIEHIQTKIDKYYYENHKMPSIVILHPTDFGWVMKGSTMFHMYKTNMALNYSGERKLLGCRVIISTDVVEGEIIVC